MNIEKADIFIITQLGSNELLNQKLQMINKTLDEVKNEKDKFGVSLLQKSIIGRKFDISKRLLNLNANINVVSDEGYNELHYIASNLGVDESFIISKQIIERGGDLNLKDKAYGNSPFNYICQEAIKHKNQNKDFFEFVSFCVSFKPNINEKNINGKTVIDIVNASRNEKLIELVCLSEQ